MFLKTIFSCLFLISGTNICYSSIVNRYNAFESESDLTYLLKYKELDYQTGLNTKTLEVKKDETDEIDLALRMLSVDELSSINTEENDFPEDRYRLGLSIDGGGVRGVMPAIWLNHLQVICDYEFGKISLSKIFDYVGGTSIGGILALGISMDKNPSEFTDIFKSKRDIIFPKSYKEYFEKIPFLGRSVKKILDNVDYTNPFVKALYPHAPLEGLLSELFGDKKLNEIQTEILVTSYTNKGDGILFTKDCYGSVPVFDIARATSAAPIYFTAHPIQIDGKILSYFDGGPFCNSPARIIAKKMTEKYSTNKNYIKVLSLGTGYTELNFHTNGGAAYLAEEVITASMVTRTRETNEGMIEKYKNNYYRVDVDLGKRIDLDDTKKGTFITLKKKAKEDDCINELNRFMKENLEIIRGKLETQDN